MKTREWEHIAKAAQSFGCRVTVREENIFLSRLLVVAAGRKVLRVVAIRRWLVSAEAQTELIGELGIAAHEWAAALRETLE